MKTHGTEHLTMNEFAEAMRFAEYCKPIIYATGDIGYSCCGYSVGKDGESIPRTDVAELVNVKAMAWAAHMRGEVCLTQRRLPDLLFRSKGASFEYLATKRNPELLKKPRIR